MYEGMYIPLNRSLWTDMIMLILRFESTHSCFSEGPTWIPHLFMQAYVWKLPSILCTKWEVITNFVYEWRSVPTLLVEGRPQTAHVLYSPLTEVNVSTPWTSLQEQCVEEANDVAKQRNGSIHARKHRKVGHGLAQYDHSGCGHWGRMGVNSLINIF